MRSSSGRIVSCRSDDQDRRTNKISAVIEGGLQAGDMAVTDGQYRIEAGSRSRCSTSGGIVRLKVAR